MTNIFVSKIPQTLDTQGSAASFKSVFTGEQNAEYLENILKKSHQKSREQSLFALEILARGLTLLGIDTQGLILKKTASGKPYFEGVDVFFSISHDADTVAVAISGQKVGIDIQSGRDASSEQNIAKRFFSEAENISIRSGKLDFLTAWTRREAYAKLTDTPLSSMLRRDLPHNVFFCGLCENGAKISVATHLHDEIQVTVLD